MGEKNRWAPFGSQSIWLTSSIDGMPWSVLDHVRNTLFSSLRSSGKKNFTPGIVEGAFDGLPEHLSYWFGAINSSIEVPATKVQFCSNLI